MVRLGFVGAGLWMRTYHLPTAASFASEGSVELAAIWNRTTEKAEELAGEFNISQLYDDFDRFLGEARVDAFVVTLTKQSVGTILGKLIERGLPILVEKPPAANAMEAGELASATSAPVMVAFNRNYTPLAQMLRSALGAGAVEFAEAHFLRRRRSDDLFVTETGIHALALLSDLLGRGTIERAERREYGESPGRSPDWHAEMRYSSGAAAHLHFMPTAGHAVERYQFHSRDSSIYVQMKQHYARDGESYLEVARVTDGGESEVRRNEFSREQVLEHDGYLGEYRHFLEVLEEGAVPRTSLQGAVSLMELAEAIEGAR